jgi:hypothetical protein
MVTGLFQLGSWSSVKAQVLVRLEKLKKRLV